MVVFPCLVCCSVTVVLQVPSQPSSTEFVSNTGMEHPDNIEQRLTDLEIKASFTEDLLDSLNQIVVRQQQQIDLLLGEVSRLRQQEPDGGVGGFRSLRDELPPHY